MRRRDFLQAALLAGASTLLPDAAWSLGDEEYFGIGRLRYDSKGWNTRPSALRRVLLEVEKRTSIRVQTDVPDLAPTSDAIFSHPFLAMSGEGRFAPFDDDAILNLRRHLRAGGFLLIDSSEGIPDGPFTRSARRLIERTLPNTKISRIPSEHVLYRSFYLVDRPVGRVVATDYLWGVFEDDRLLVVISPNDLMGAWARDNFGQWTYAVAPGGERQRELAFRMGINLAMYALCINYKADQVHVPFILRRRQWKVD